MRKHKLSSGWIWPGLRAGLFAAFVSGILLYLTLILFFRHLFTNSYDYMLAPILFISHLSVLFGVMGIAAGVFWRAISRIAKRRVRPDDARALCMCSCIAGAAAFFAAAWVAFGAQSGKDTGTAFGLLAVAAVAACLVWLLHRGAFRRFWVSLLPSNRGALALLILSAFGTVLGKSVRSEYLTARPQSYFEGIMENGAPIVEGREARKARASEAAGGEAASARAGKSTDGVRRPTARGAANSASGATNDATRAANDATAAQRPNVLLLTVDTFRSDHLGCYGYHRNASPSVDSLAADGVLFANAYAQRPKASPSFASILTGTYPQRHGVRRTKQALPCAAYTLTEALKAAGYATCGVVTNGNLFPAFGFDQGFDEYAYGHGGAQRGTEIALDWLKRRVPRPFFLWVHHTDPHTPYRPPAPYDVLFVDEVEYGKHPLEIVRGRALGGVHPRFLIEGPLDLDYYISQYDGEIAYTDYWIGRLLDGLTARGLAESTLVVFTADHGESLGEHGYYFEHGLLPYDQSARIPLIFSLPGVTGRGAVEDPIAESVDIMPTVLDLLGLETPPTCQGRSLLAAAGSLADPEATGPGRIGPGRAGVGEGGPGAARPGGAAVAETGEGQGGNSKSGRAGNKGHAALADAGKRTTGSARLAYIEAGVGHHEGPGYTFAVTDGRYKLVVRDIAWVVRPRDMRGLIYMLKALFEGGAANHELYDLKRDPGETDNLIGELPEESERLRSGLEGFLERMRNDGALPPDTRERELDEVTLRSLRALGYVR